MPSASQSLVLFFLFVLACCSMCRLYQGLFLILHRVEELKLWGGEGTITNPFIAPVLVPILLRGEMGVLENEPEDCLSFFTCYLCLNIPVILSKQFTLLR